MKKLKKIKDNNIIKSIIKIISWIFLILFSLLIIILLYFLFNSNLFDSNNEKRPNIGIYAIVSQSMEPNIKVYDMVVTIKENNISSFKEGDIISFVSEPNNIIITHRISEIVYTDKGIRFKTKGDNNSNADSALVSSNKIIGKVLFKIPSLGKILLLLQSKNGLIFALLIPAFIIVMYDVYKLLKLLKMKKEMEKSSKKKKKNS